MDIKTSQTELHKFEIFSERGDGSIVDGLTSVNPFVVHVHWLWQEVDGGLQIKSKLLKVNRRHRVDSKVTWKSSRQTVHWILAACLLLSIFTWRVVIYSTSNMYDLSSCTTDLARLFVVAKWAGELGVQCFNVLLPRFWLSLGLPATHPSFGAQIWNSRKLLRIVVTANLIFCDNKMITGRGKFYFCMPAIFRAVVASPPSSAATSPGTCIQKLKLWPKRGRIENLSKARCCLQVTKPSVKKSPSVLKVWGPGSKEVFRGPTEDIIHYFTLMSSELHYLDIIPKIENLH